MQGATKTARTESEETRHKHMHMCARTHNDQLQTPIF